jgi:hypothetical protein
MGHRTHDSFLGVLTWTSVNLWMEVPSTSLAINEIPYAIRNEAHEVKNTNFKPQEKKCI